MQSEDNECKSKLKVQRKVALSALFIMSRLRGAADQQCGPGYTHARSIAYVRVMWGLDHVRERENYLRTSMALGLFDFVFHMQS
jgi:hypothetical protein